MSKEFTTFLYGNLRRDSLLVTQEGLLLLQEPSFLNTSLLNAGLLLA